MAQQSQQMSAKAAAVTQQLAALGWDVEIRLSTRRKKTINARPDGHRTIILAPAWLSEQQLLDRATDLVQKVHRKVGRGMGGVASDEELEQLARQLNEKHLGGRARWDSIRWVGNMTTRWGSCTPTTGRIRISDRLQHVPDYVLDSVVIHELVHTWVPNHSAEFWEWAGKAPKLERTRGYLEAFQWWGGADDR